jgi:calcineurin-like phosphoesterase
MLQFIETEPRIIRPLNFSKSAPGRGAAIFTATRGRKVLVAQVLGQVFMKRPFRRSVFRCGCDIVEASPGRAGRRNCGGYAL